MHELRSHSGRDGCSNTVPDTDSSCSYTISYSHTRSHRSVSAAFQCQSLPDHYQALYCCLGDAVPPGQQFSCTLCLLPLCCRNGVQACGNLCRFSLHSNSTPKCDCRHTGCNTLTDPLTHPFTHPLANAYSNPLTNGGPLPTGCASRGA